jgi:hypothetical protein
MSIPDDIIIPDIPGRPWDDDEDDDDWRLRNEDI